MTYSEYERTGILRRPWLEALAWRVASISTPEILFIYVLFGISSYTRHLTRARPAGIEVVIR